jgi:uncharacterized membrane protein YcaP (DUF421 family)
MNLCKFKDNVILTNIFGKPNEGIHQFRVFDIAIIDFIGTIFGAWLVSYFFKLPFLYLLVVFFALGILAHRIFCVRTTIDKILFP